MEFIYLWGGGVEGSTGSAYMQDDAAICGLINESVIGHFVYLTDDPIS